MPQKYLLLCLVIFGFGQKVWSTTAEYWIIENPSALVIYDKYEQRLAETEKNLFPGFSAWRILDDNHLLSDQFTHTIKTEHNQKIYFIQLSSDGDLVNYLNAGQIQKLKTARVQGDTVRVKNDGQLSLRSGYKQYDLSEGMLVTRLFLYRGKTFARNLASGVAGWIQGNGPANWEAYIPDNSEIALEEQLFSRVDHIFNTHNNRLDKLFIFLNKQYNKSKISPKWIAEKSASYLRYSMTPQDYGNQFSDSQSYLIQELNDLLYGSAYQLHSTAGEIVISKLSR